MTALALMNAAENEMDRAIAGTGWARISLGNLITIAAAVIGFLLTIQQMKTDVGAVKDQVTGLTGKVDKLQDGQYSETVSVKGVTDRLDNMDIQLTAHNNRFDSVDVRLRAVESAMTTFEAIQKAQNQALEIKHR